ncbi:hypothetical protein AMS68_004440 [Peltaster fructicola]|uniref:Uncharacterized protein n=1 Tax=Peltaster fructicola TaxID=286661 RepID=A0A6H0XVZ8_9PEZI|nr:hypothetical protein AMS68_004440 [Peltaster fructicola]
MSTELKEVMATEPRKPLSQRQDMLQTITFIVKDIQQLSTEAGFIKPFPRSKLRNKDSRKECPETFLHLLPGELRNRIYRIIGFPSKRQHLDDIKEPFLAQAIPSLRPEILAMLFAEATFEVDTYSELMVHSSYIAPQRAKFRGGRYGTGTLKLVQDNWIRKADQLAVRFHHVHIQVREMDGSKICLIVLNNTRGTKRNGPRMSVQSVTSQHLKSRLRDAKDMALKYVRELRKDKDHPGFALVHLEKIAEYFKDPDTVSWKTKAG